MMLNELSLLRERVKLIIENWFIEKTSIKPTDDGLNNLVDRIVYDKQLSIHGVVKSFVCPNGCGQNGDAGSCMQCVGK